MSRAPCRVAARESNCAQHGQQINLNHGWTRRCTNGIKLRPSSVAQSFEISIAQQAALVLAAPCFGVERSASQHDDTHDAARTFSPKCKAPAAGQTRNAQLQTPKRQLPSFVSIRGLNQIGPPPHRIPLPSRCSLLFDAAHFTHHAKSSRRQTSQSRPQRFSRMGTGKNFHRARLRVRRLLGGD